MKMIVLALFFICEIAYSRNIVLLTSLPANQLKLQNKVEKIFIKKTRDFSEDYQIIVKHAADQEMLFKYLNDADTHALFWLSHGAYLKSDPNAAIKPAPMLLDFQKDNVAKVFQKINPNIKFIGVIGCNSQQILENVLKERDDLDSYIPQKKIIAQWALKRSIKHFRYTHYRKDNTLKEAVPTLSGLEVKVVRKTNNKADSYKSLKVFVGGELITVLPKMAANSVAEYKLFVPFKERYSKPDLKIILESGQNPLDEKDYIGELSLSYKEKSLWRLFSKPGGEAFGTNERIFIFTGSHFNIGEQ